MGETGAVTNSDASSERWAPDGTRSRGTGCREGGAGAIVEPTFGEFVWVPTEAQRAQGVRANAPGGNAMRTGS